MAMYFTTDTHFGHPLVSALRGFIADDDIKAGYDHAVVEQGIAAAAQYVKRAANKRHLRMADIADTDAHDAAVIASINATLTPADELWIMGDVGYRTSMEHIRHCLHAIHARRLHLVVGNHDVNFHHRELDGEWHHAFATIQDSAIPSPGVGRRMASRLRHHPGFGDRHHRRCRVPSQPLPVPGGYGRLPRSDRRCVRQRLRPRLRARRVATGRPPSAVRAYASAHESRSADGLAARRAGFVGIEAGK